MPLDFARLGRVPHSDRTCGLREHDHTGRPDLGRPDGCDPSKCPHSEPRDRSVRYHSARLRLDHRDGSDHEHFVRPSLDALLSSRRRAPKKKRIAAARKAAERRQDCGALDEAERDGDGGRYEPDSNGTAAPPVPSGDPAGPPAGPFEGGPPGGCPVRELDGIAGGARAFLEGAPGVTYASGAAALPSVPLSLLDGSRPCDVRRHRWAADDSPGPSHREVCCPVESGSLQCAWCTTALVGERCPVCCVAWLADGADDGADDVPGGPRARDSRSASPPPPPTPSPAPPASSAGGSRRRWADVTTPTVSDSEPAAPLTARSRWPRRREPRGRRTYDGGYGPV